MTDSQTIELFMKPLIAKIHALQADKRNAFINEMTKRLRAELLPVLETCEICGYQAPMLWRQGPNFNLTTGESFYTVTCANKSGLHK